MREAEGPTAGCAEEPPELARADGAAASLDEGGAELDAPEPLHAELHAATIDKDVSRASRQESHTSPDYATHATSAIARPDSEMTMSLSFG